MSNPFVSRNIAINIQNRAIDIQNRRLTQLMFKPYRVNKPTVSPDKLVAKKNAYF